MKIALFTVFYPGIERYVEDFISSIRNQSYKNFNLIIVNDGYSKTAISKLYPDLTIVELAGTNNIACNRAIGINHCIEERYDYLFLCDADDTFKSNRIEACLKKIGENDILVTDLDIVAETGNILYKNYFSMSIGIEQKINYEFIRNKNIFGFSNTILKVKSLKKVKFPKELKVVDWYYFTCLLREGLHAMYIPDSFTQYRQHGNNMIGSTYDTFDSFKKLIKLKKLHYFLLSKHYLDYNSDYKRMEKLDALPEKNKNKIYNQSKIKINYPLWWENI